ncbi:DUF805 domain-containing protein [Acinetobacter sp. NIPH 2699]|uniref:DUF805 domain-containing protein n=1 Tax=Acinetobacter sp. NIPH 2699 TaxID=2923433 RepID=UPI001F4A903D|nr:DUF805 domain-containing protein [Acinetobacter sp. NIPH 2699]MCH7335778.1 DUF805 domain-containing protein [Acinetobacter sp. NIPH 2699]
MNSPIQTVDKPLSAKGRFGRLSFAAWTMLMTIVFCIVIFILAFASFGGNLLVNSDFPLITVLLFIVIYAAMIYISFIFTIRRLHDRNQTGWLSLLMLIPFFNLIFLIYLLAAKGSDGENNYGPLRETAGWEKVLGWIYIVILPLAFVFGIIGAIALPAYQGYIERSQQIQMEYQQNYSE